MMRVLFTVLVVFCIAWLGMEVLESVIEFGENVRVITDPSTYLAADKPVMIMGDK